MNPHTALRECAREHHMGKPCCARSVARRSMVDRGASRRFYRLMRKHFWRTESDLERQAPGASQSRRRGRFDCKCHPPGDPARASAH